LRFYARGKKSPKKRAGGVDQAVGPEFKPQYHKKERKKERKKTYYRCCYCPVLQMRKQAQSCAVTCLPSHIW
jgi:hypothetical protein